MTCTFSKTESRQEERLGSFKKIQNIRSFSWFFSHILKTKPSPFPFALRPFDFRPRCFRRPRRPVLSAGPLEDSAAAHHRRSLTGRAKVEKVGNWEEPKTASALKEKRQPQNNNLWACSLHWAKPRRAVSKVSAGMNGLTTCFGIKSVADVTPARCKNVRMSRSHHVFLSGITPSPFSSQHRSFKTEENQPPQGPKHPKAKSAYLPIGRAQRLEDIGLALPALPGSSAAPQTPSPKRLRGPSLWKACVLKNPGFSTVWVNAFDEVSPKFTSPHDVHLVSEFHWGADSWGVSICRCFS